MFFYYGLIKSSCAPKKLYRIIFVNPMKIKKAEVEIKAIKGGGYSLSATNKRADSESSICFYNKYLN